MFKKRPCGPVLKDSQQKNANAWRSPRLGNGQSRSGRGLSLRTGAKRTEHNLSFFSAMVLAAAYMERCCL